MLALEIKTGRMIWSKQVMPGDVFSGACTTKPGGCPGPDFDFGFQRDAEGNEIRATQGQRGAPQAGGAFPGIIGVIFGRSAGTALIEECYEPGRPPADFRPYNAAKLIPAGTDVAVNVHYTPNGNPVTHSCRSADQAIRSYRGIRQR